MRRRGSPDEGNLAHAGGQTPSCTQDAPRRRTLRPGRFSVRAVETIVGAHPAKMGRKMFGGKPHDLRRTVARQLYKAGFELGAIWQNLGHANVKTKLGYIGELDDCKVGD